MKKELTRSLRKHEANLESLLSKISETNRATAKKYIPVRRIRGLQPSSLVNYALTMRRIDNYVDGKALTNVLHDDLLHFLTDTREQVSYSTLVAYIRLTRRLMMDLHDGKLPPGMGALLVAKDPPPPDNANLVSREQRDQLIQAAETLPRSRTFDRVTRNQALVATIWDSGFCMGELLSLRFRDIELTNDGAWLRLDATHPDLKTGARAVFVTECKAWLSAWMSVHPGPRPIATSS
jgi:integrase